VLVDINRHSDSSLFSFIAEIVPRYRAVGLLMCRTAMVFRFVRRVSTAQ
jgi:hypothetical protein